MIKNYLKFSINVILRLYKILPVLLLSSKCELNNDKFAVEELLKHMNTTKVSN